MPESKLITYNEAAELFRRAGLPASVRHVRTKIWLHPKICPVLTPIDGSKYHVKRMLMRDVRRLIQVLQEVRAAK